MPDLTNSFATEAQFLKIWPEAAEAIVRLHDPDIFSGNPIPSSTEHALSIAVQEPSINLIGGVVRAAWNFDSRFFGDIVGGGRTDFQAAVYLLVYCCKDPEHIDLGLKAFVPFLGSFARSSWSDHFVSMMCSTFFEYANVAVFELSDAEGFDQAEFFDWHGSLNQLSSYERALRLSYAGLEPLEHESLPPFEVMQSMGVWIGHTEETYLRDIMRFYADLGYPFERPAEVASPIIGKLEHFLHELRFIKEMSREAEPSMGGESLAVLSTDGRDLIVQLPSGTALIPIRSGRFYGEAAILTSSLEGLVKGLKKLKSLDAEITLTVGDENVQVLCESLSVRIDRQDVTQGVR
jgi:hypothetical protein